MRQVDVWLTPDAHITNLWLTWVNGFNMHEVNRWIGDSVAISRLRNGKQGIQA